MGNCYIEFKEYNEAIANFENVVQKAIDINDTERLMIGLCNVVKCKVLANLSESEYARQLNEIKRIYDENKEAQNIT